MPSRKFLISCTQAFIYIGIVIFIVSVLTNFFYVLSPSFYKVVHSILFFVAFWYFVWHFRITKGHRASYDRISEGTILLMIIYNPFYPFILDIGVWMFLDFIFIWVFMLYIIEIRDIQQKIKDGKKSWGDASDELI